MERNKSVLLGDLKHGDRFYKAGDAKKIIQQVKSVRASHTSVINPFLKPEFQERNAKSIKNNTPVIFLRNASEEVIEE